MNDNNKNEIIKLWKDILFDKTNDGMFLEKAFHHRKQSQPEDFKDHIYLVKSFNKFNKLNLPEDISYGKTFRILKLELSKIDPIEHKKFILWLISEFKKRVGGKSESLYFRKERYKKIKKMYVFLSRI